MSSAVLIVASPYEAARIARVVERQGFTPRVVESPEGAMDEWRAAQPVAAVVSARADGGAGPLVQSLRRLAGGGWPILVLGTGATADEEALLGLATLRQAGAVEPLLLSQLLGDLVAGPGGGLDGAFDGSTVDESVAPRLERIADAVPSFDGDLGLARGAGAGSRPAAAAVGRGAPGSVEGGPSAEEPAPLPSSAPLGLFDLAELLAALAVARRSCRIELRHRRGEVRFHLAAGQLVAVESGRRDDELVERLRRSGRLDEAQRRRAEEQIASGRSAVEALGALGLLPPAEVAGLAARHAAALLVDAFAIDDGAWRLRPLRPGERGWVRLERPLPLLLRDGLRRHYGPERLRERLGGPRAEILGTSRLDRVAAAAFLSPTEQEILPLLGTPQPLQQLLDRAWHDASEVLVLLHFLAVSGAVAIRPAERLPSLVELRRRLEQGDYFQLLGLPRAVEPVTARYAWRRLRRAILLLDEAVREELRDELPRIVEAIDDAVMVLGERGRAAAYLTGLPSG